MQSMFKRNRGKTMHDDLTDGEYDAAQDEEVPVLELDLEEPEVPEAAPFAYKSDPGKDYVSLVVNASFNEFRKGDRLKVDKDDEMWAAHIASGMASVVD